MTRNMKFLMAMSLVIMAGAPLYAEPIQRSLSIDLEEVPNVKGYEVRWTRVLPDGKRSQAQVARLTTNNWSTKLAPGKYEFHVRTIDKRNVPGEWGAVKLVDVPLPPPRLDSPSNNSLIKSDEINSDKIKFSWQKVEGAEKYKLRIVDRKGAVVHDSEPSDNSIEIDLNVANEYNWTVVPYMEGLEGNSSSSFKVTVLGDKLATPDIATISDINTTQIAWKGVEKTEAYEYKLEYKNKKGDWKAYDVKDLKLNSRNFKTPLYSGTYRVTVKAKADLRPSSDESVMEFKTEKINRSPAAIEQMKSEASYETKSKFFFLASYYYSHLNYSGSEIKQGSQATNGGPTYDVDGGTGRVGVGTWFNENSSWGALFTGDLSGYQYDKTEPGGLHTYFSAALQAVYRYRLGGIGKIRFNMGLQYRELPITVGELTSSDEQNFYLTQMTTVGPLGGFTFYRGITREIGIQANFQAAVSAFGLKTSNGGENIPEVSLQMGLMGSMKLGANLVGFLGYAYRTEQVKYKATRTGADQENAEIQGHYLNLLLEYGF